MILSTLLFRAQRPLPYSTTDPLFCRTSNESATNNPVLNNGKLNMENSVEAFSLAIRSVLPERRYNKYRKFGLSFALSNTSSTHASQRSLEQRSGYRSNLVPPKRYLSAPLSAKPSEVPIHPNTTFHHQLSPLVAPHTLSTHLQEYLHHSKLKTEIDAPLQFTPACSNFILCQSHKFRMT